MPCRLPYVILLLNETYLAYVQLQLFAAIEVGIGKFSYDNASDSYWTLSGEYRHLVCRKPVDSGDSGDSKFCDYQ